MIWGWLAHPWPGYPFGNFFCLSCFLCDCIELLLSEDEATIRLSVSSWPAGNSCSGLGSMYSSMSMLKEGLRVMWGTSSISSSSVAWKRQSWENFHKICVVLSWIITLNWCVALQLDKECPNRSLPLPFGQRNNTSLQIFHKLLTSQTRSGLTEFAVVLEHQPLLQSSKLMPPGKQTTIKTTHSAIRTTLQQTKIINKHTYIETSKTTSAYWQWQHAGGLIKVLSTWLISTKMYFMNKIPNYDFSRLIAIKILYCWTYWTRFDKFSFFDWMKRRLASSISCWL